MSIEEIKKALTPHTRLIIINNPSNPTGVVWEEGELEEIAQLAKEKDLVIISDEIYEHLTYDGAKVKSIATFPGMKERTIVINGVSKAFSMTGWRIGYAAGPQDVIAVSYTHLDVYKRQEQTTAQQIFTSHQFFIPGGIRN